MYAFAGLAGAVVGALSWASKKKRLARSAEGYENVVLNETARQVLGPDGSELVQQGAQSYSRLTQTIDVTRDPNFMNNATASNYAQSLQDAASTVGYDSNGKLVVKANNDVRVPTIVENNVIGYVRKCEEVVGLGANPFSDAAFAESCGVCHEGGKNSAGADMVGGLYVSPASKETAKYRAQQSGRRNPAYGPSVGSCAPGMFSVSSADYDRIQRQMECAKKQNYSVPGCAQCEGGGFVFTDSAASKAPISINVKGEGKLSFSHGGKLQSLTLNNGEGSSIEPEVPLAEGDVFYLKVERADASSPLPYIAGIMTAPTVTGMYAMDIGRTIGVDTVTGAKPRIRGSTTVKGTTATIFRPAAGQTAMTLQVDVPYTFIEPNEESAAACPSGPLLMKESSATKLGAGACFAKGSGPGAYSLECVQQLWTDAGCTAAGSDYPKDTASARTLAGQKSLGALADDFYGRGLASNSGISAAGTRLTMKERDEIAQRCTGKRYGNPCDMYDNGEALGVDCLDYLYKNTEGAPCNAAGRGAPVGATGQQNKEVISMLQGLGGVEAVRQHYRDVYRRATDNSLADKDREAAVEQCFGTGFYYNPKEKPTSRALNSLLTNPTAGQKTPFERVSYSYPAGVQSAVVLGQYGMGPWGSAGFSDTSAFWIWNQAGAQSSAPIFNPVDIPAFYYVYEHKGASPLNARIDFIVDNIGDLYVNGELIGLGHQGGWGGDYVRNGNRKDVRLLPGTNLIKFSANNSGGPAGVILAAFDGGGKVLFHTDSSWKTKRAYDVLEASSVTDKDNYGIWENNTVSNLIKPVSSGLQWNPISTATVEGLKTYRLLVKFPQVQNISFVRFLTSGDVVHDPTAIRIYRDESKTEMGGSYGSLAGRQSTDVILHQMSFKTDQLYIELDKTSRYQIWLQRIQFYSNN